MEFVFMVLKRVYFACRHVLQIKIPVLSKRVKVYIGIAFTVVLFWFLTIGYFCFYREKCYEELLRSSDAEVRAETVRKIRGRYFMSLMFNDVVKLTNDNSSEVRLQVISFLGTFNKEYTDKANFNTIYPLSEMIFDENKLNRHSALTYLEVAIRCYTRDFKVYKKEDIKYPIGLIKNLILAFQQNINDNEQNNRILISASLSTISGDYNFELSPETDCKKLLDVYLNWFHVDVLDLPLIHK